MAPIRWVRAVLLIALALAVLPEVSRTATALDKDARRAQREKERATVAEDASLRDFAARVHALAGEGTPVEIDLDPAYHLAAMSTAGLLPGVGMLLVLF